ncbi:hypothetical protein CDAR_245411 [Caerostris darwini]|uniref:Uncharacterized protein n=1 Tax=Caerostris darwini TaxID=1538125 RepID=A0AAV4NZR4_9ARAC|nr:hypothetical protein CDAR_245411 [Caerostris darwini]
MCIVKANFWFDQRRRKEKKTKCETKMNKKGEKYFPEEWQQLVLPPEKQRGGRKKKKEKKKERKDENMQIKQQKRSEHLRTFVLLRRRTFLRLHSVEGICQRSVEGKSNRA